MSNSPLSGTREISLKDFDNICRICCTFSSELVDIFQDGMDSKIKEISHIKIATSDTLPKQICSKCQELLDQCHKLLKDILSSDKYLRTLLRSAVGDGGSKPKRTVRKRRKARSNFSQTKRRRKCNSNQKQTAEENEKLYIVIVPEKNNDVEEEMQKSVMNSVVESDHAYHCNFGVSEIKEEKVDGMCQDITLDSLLSSPKDEPSDKLADNLMEFIKNFGKDGLSDTDEPKGIAEFENEDLDYNVEYTDFSTPCNVYKICLGDYKCIVCHEQYPTYEEYSDHSRNVHAIPKIFMEYTCPVCRKTGFNCSNSFIEHLTIHKTNQQVFVKVDSYGIPESVRDDELLFTPFGKVIDMLENDKRSIDDFKVNSFIISSDDTENKIYRVFEPLACDYCIFQADSEKSLSDHYFTQHQKCTVFDSKFSCPVCKTVVMYTGEESRALFYTHLRVHIDDGYKFIKVNSQNYVLELNEKETSLFSLSDPENSEVNWNFLSSYDQSENTKALTTPFADIPICKPNIVVQYDSKSKNADKLYVCDVCSKVFKKRLGIIQHLRTHETDNQNDIHCCEKCGKVFNSRSKYNKHFKCHDIFSRIIKSKRKSCVFCSKVFVNSATLEKHILCHIESSVNKRLQKTEAALSKVCEICGRGFNSNKMLKKHKTLHSVKDNSKKCIICEREFTKMTTYSKHMAAHLNPSCIECNICKYPLLTQRRFERHAQLHRDGGSHTYDCPTCSVSFLTKESLIAHQGQLGHNKDTMECNVCQEVFFSGKEFSQHIKMHPKYKSTECNLCGKRLSTAQSLSLHVARHFESNGILCPHCGKAFYEKKNFDRHLLTHDGYRPFTCDVENCPKSFYTLFELKRHKKYHDNKRDFKCEHCHKSFHEANHLTVHIRSHTGERPYNCPHCKKGFVTRTRCKQHIKLVHKGIGYDQIQSKISKKVAVFEPVNVVVSCL